MAWRHLSENGFRVGLCVVGCRLSVDCGPSSCCGDVTWWDGFYNWRK